MRGIEGKRETYRRKATMAKLAKQRCLQCVKDEVRDCEVKDCKFYPYNPYAKRLDSD